MKNSTQPRRALAALALGAALCAAPLTGCSTEPSQGDSTVASQGTGETDPAPPGASPSERVPAGTETEAPSAPPTTEAADPNLPSDTMTAADPTPEDATPAAPGDAPQLEVATLGAGCFWCIEAVLEQVDGVESVVSGYMGGQTLNPTYKDICTGTTGHAEVVQVTFNPKVLPYTELLDWFWRSHDPTTLNRQGNDRGTQYRSAIFTHSETQLSHATTSKADVAPTFSDPIVTEVTPASTFYPAEGYHQGYYFNNTSQGYCRAIIAPKLKKLGLKY